MSQKKSGEDVIKFITGATDDKYYLMTKVALVFGTYGACRREELANMLTNHIEGRDSVIVVTISKSKTKQK